MRERRERYGMFFFWILLFIFEYGLFRTYALREVIDKVPLYIDQVQYLNQTYKMYDLLLHGDIRGMLSYGLSTGGNGGMKFIGVIFLALFGYSRLSLLSLNFIFFYLMQLALFFYLYCAAKSFSLGIAGCGMLLLVKTTFVQIGDMLDYRWDFSAFCVYTIWLCVMLIAVAKQNRKLWNLSALAAGFLVFIRFNTIVYVGIVLIIYWGVNFASDKNKKFIFLIKEIMGYVLLGILGGGWFLLINLKNFIGYYYHAYTSTDQVLWQLGLTGWDNLIYYPQGVIQTHLGVVLSVILMMCTIISLIILFLRKIKISISDKNSILLVVTAIFIPLIVLTVSKNKNLTVISVINGACILLVLILMSIMIRQIETCKLMRNLLFGFIFILGAGNYFIHCMRIRQDYSNESEKGAAAINQTVGEYIWENEIDDPEIIVDRMIDTVFSNTFNVWFYENYGAEVNITNAIAGMPDLPLTFRFGENEFLEGLKKTDFIIVSENGYSAPSDYPTDVLMDTYRQELVKYAKEKMVPLTVEECSGEILTVYAREKTKIILSSSWKDWLGVDDTTIYLDKTENTGWLVLEGQDTFPYENMSIRCEKEGIELPVQWEAEEGRYRLRIDLSDCDTGFTYMKLFIDNYFNPSEISNSKDNRKLAIRYPDAIYVE